MNINNIYLKPRKGVPAVAETPCSHGASTQPTLSKNSGSAPVTLWHKEHKDKLKDVADEFINTRKIFLGFDFSCVLINILSGCTRCNLGGTFPGGGGGGGHAPRPP